MIYYTYSLIYLVLNLLFPMSSTTPKQEQQKIGLKITEAREAAGLTQLELAQRLKTSQSAMARMEKGEQNFSTALINKISRALDREIITVAGEAINFRITGGYKLTGTITTNVSKNAAVGLLCAALLNRGKTTLKRLPRIAEVERIVEVLTSIGVTIKRRENDDVEITPPEHFNLKTLDTAAAMKTRSIIMLLGPLVHYLTHFSLPHAGGCKLGTRTVRPHLFALEKLGIKIKVGHDGYEVRVKKLKPNTIVQYESGDTVTENVLMAAAKIPGTTVIKFASANYQVQDMCFFLQKLGVVIEGIGTTTITIHGKAAINETVEYSPAEDPIESMLFIALAATTNSSITIKRCPIEFLELELLKLEKMGWRFKISKRYKANNGETDLVDIATFPSHLKALEEKIYARPYPGLNMDNLPFFVPIATQAKGRTLIHDWPYENRAIYYTELIKLGANILLADPHRIYVDGPTNLRATEVICPPALRPAVIILIAMLAAPGVSVLRNVYSISRGYEDLAVRLRQLGAKIEVLL